MRNALKPAQIELPYYQPVYKEIEVFEHCYRQKLPVMLKGPTGCGKSRFVEHMAARLERPLITVACHDDTTASDLLGRYLIEGDHTRWCDGPVTRAVRLGAVLYLDEIAEARPDVVVALHPLSDHRRELFLERTGETLTAHPEFMLVASYNPGYQRGFKEMKPSTKQRFVSLDFNYPKADIESGILMGETGIDQRGAENLVKLAKKLRNLDRLGLAEQPSTRLLVDAAKLIVSGLPTRLACKTAVVSALTDDPETAEAMHDLVNLVF